MFYSSVPGRLGSIISKCTFSRRKRQANLNCPRKLSVKGKHSIVLGIETSCDDTGCAIVDSDKNILGEALHSQQDVHLRMGGIIPPIARNLHRQYIEEVVHDALAAAGMKVDDVDAIATTVKPGLALSLCVGKDYGKLLCRQHSKPFIPIHHMEAHALTVRMVKEVEFPFLVLLISGGHCQLAVVERPDRFLLLGESIDDAPGEAFDKAARRLKMRNLPEFAHLSGGAAIELAAKRGDPKAFPFPSSMTRYNNCDFSFAGLKNIFRNHILKQEEDHVEPDGFIPGLYDLCASYQFAITKHLCRRLQRAMEYIEKRNLLPATRKNLVVSGGVACNHTIARVLDVVCQSYDYQLSVPPPKLCTDNGVMIAWNGMEKWMAGIDVTEDLDTVDIQPKCALGISMRHDIEEARVKCKLVKEKALLAAAQES